MLLVHRVVGAGASARSAVGTSLIHAWQAREAQHHQRRCVRTSTFLSLLSSGLACSLPLPLLTANHVSSTTRSTRWIPLLKSLNIWSSTPPLIPLHMSLEAGAEPGLGQAPGQDLVQCCYSVHDATVNESIYSSRPRSRPPGLGPVSATGWKHYRHGGMSAARRPSWMSAR